MVHVAIPYDLDGLGRRTYIEKPSFSLHATLLKSQNLFVFLVA